jgi:glyoxylase-like metal-dependent hydrolase (beta-lactamase superfamily II)
VKQSLLRAGAIALALVAAIAVHAQTPAVGLEILQLRPNVYMIAGGGANVTVQTGEDGAVVVDAGSAQSGDAIAAAIKKITSAPIRYVIDTSADADHIGGNDAIAKTGETLFGTRSNGLPADFGGNRASILSFEKVLSHVSAPTGKVAPFPQAVWPTETFNYPRHAMYLNGEGIEIVHQAAAHSDADSTVFFRRSDVLVTGDIFDTTRFPVIDVAHGGSLQGEIDSLNRLIAIAIPSVPIVSREAGTIVVPGHGHLSDQYDLVHYRDMLTIIRDHVADLMKAGKTLDEIKAAAPAKGYAPRYGSDSGPWTTNNFIEAVYRSLSAAKKS